MEKVGKEILQIVYPVRPSKVRKYDYGMMLVIGGSDFYSGAPALSALAGFRAGVDMVRIIAPRRAADIIASFSPILAAYPLEGSYLSKQNLATLFSMTESAESVTKGKTAVVIGGGMGRTQETQEVILEYLSKVNMPCVLDADALHALSKNPEAISGKPFVITPNAYEFLIITGKDVVELSQEDKIKVVQEEAERLGTTIILKGNIDIISDGKQTGLNSTGLTFMTVGGTGDVLSGIVGALLARDISPFQAALAASYINGKAGEIAGKKYGESMIATDVIDAIQEAIK